MRHSKDDAKWIHEQLDNLPFRFRQVAQDGYSATYAEAYEAEPQDHKKENAARFAANTKLRKYLKKMLAIDCERI